MVVLVGLEEDGVLFYLFVRYDVLVYFVGALGGGCGFVLGRGQNLPGVGEGLQVGGLGWC